MPDGLYERDILAWSQNQADLLRRLGRGERVNDVDWDNVVEEIESVGLSEFHALESFLILTIAHVLKLRAWPDGDARLRWQAEVVNFQSQARRHFSPSMRQRVDMNGLYADAVKPLRVEFRTVPWPPDNPFTLDQLLSDELEALLARLPTAP